MGVTFGGGVCHDYSSEMMFSGSHPIPWLPENIYRAPKPVSMVLMVLKKINTSNEKEKCLM